MLYEVITDQEVLLHKDDNKELTVGNFYSVRITSYNVCYTKLLRIKSTLLTALLGGGILALIIWVYALVGTNFWLYAWLLVGSVMVLMSMFYTSLLLPLFNKQKPLDDGELRDAIEAFSLKSGFKLDNVFVMDGSKRSTKANAFFSGLGRKKRIVLYDTLINDLSSQEVVV